MSNRRQRTTGSAVIEARNIFKSFDDGKIRVLNDVSLKIGQGELVALWGASGSGKTTLLHMMGGLDIPDCGSISVGGLDPSNDKDRLDLRRSEVGFVFQLHNLIPDLTLKENCMVTCIANRGKSKDYESRFEQLSKDLAIHHRRNHRIQELSGGERQRVSLCRALMHRPRVILADEPTGSLDEQNGEAVFQLLKGMARKEETTVVMATHERRFADACDRIFRVRDGHVSEVSQGGE